MALSFLEQRDLVQSKDNIIQTINETKKNMALFMEKYNTCEDKIANKILDVIFPCGTFLEKFNYHMKNFWNDSRKQIDEIGK